MGSGCCWTWSPQVSVAYVRDFFPTLGSQELAATVSMLAQHSCCDTQTQWKSVATTWIITTNVNHIYCKHKMITFWSRSYKNIVPSSHWDPKNFCPGLQWERVPNSRKSTTIQSCTNTLHVAALTLGFKVINHYYSMSGTSQMRELIFYYIHKHILKSNWGVKSLAENTLKVLKFFSPALLPLKKCIKTAPKVWLKL